MKRFVIIFICVTVVVFLINSIMQMIMNGRPFMYITADILLIRLLVSIFISINIYYREDVWNTRR